MTRRLALELPVLQKRGCAVATVNSRLKSTNKIFDPAGNEAMYRTFRPVIGWSREVIKGGKLQLLKFPTRAPKFK